MKHLLPIPDTPPKESTVMDWLAKGIAASLDQPALNFKGVVLSYRELDEQSHRVANYLIASGVAPGDRVGLCLDRSIEMIVAVVGILKSGAAYVPLDPAYPANRLAMMVEDAGLHCLLAHAAHAALFTAPIIWEKMITAIESESIEASNVVIDPESPAYIIFTSGSTGRPKGIEMPHRALANLIEWQLERKSFKPAARVLQYSSISFDVSFQEIATTFASGGTLFLISTDDQKDPRRLLAQLRDQKTERLFLPYVAMRSLMETANGMKTYPAALKEIITAGEQLRVDDTVRRFIRQTAGVSLDNQYGPSETHVITAHPLEGDPAAWPDLPCIGTPLKNCGTLILDEAMLPVEDGQEGELFLAGRNLATGYIGRKDLTNEAFVPNPFETPERPLLYKTGDLAAYNPDGSIEFRGRRDHQIKIRGHRIEPGEINNAAASFPGLGQCLAHASKSADGTLQLAAYYTVETGCTVEHAALRTHLETQLPGYMVPAFLIELAEIPYTPSGKVDLKALPKPSIQNSQYAGEEVRYESETEQALAQIWSDLLGMDGIPRSADFFEIGGDSLRAVTLFLKIQQQFSQDLPLATLTHAYTLAALAQVIEGKSDAPDLSGYRSLTMMQQGNETVIPLFLIHGGQGNVLVFNKFVHMLDPSQPVYAFQWSGWDGHRGDGSIKAMARAYCNELLRFLPDGPLRLGGYCIGGLIAVELVRLLKQAGREVTGPVVVWDSPNLESTHYQKGEPWDSAESIEKFNTMKDGLEAIRIETSADPDSVPKTEYVPPTGKAALIRKIPGAMEFLRMAKALSQDLKTLPDRIRIAIVLARGKSLAMNQRSQYCHWMLVAAVKRHRSSTYDGPVLYFRSDCTLARFFGLTGWWNDPFLGFAEVCTGHFEAHAIGGGHTDVVEIPEMGEIVRQRFAE